MFDRCATERASPPAEGLALIVDDGMQFGVDGTELATIPLQGQPRLFLGRRDGVPLLVTHAGKLLLAQHRGRASAFWSTLAGFVEPGESLEDAVRRELAEETGLAAKELRYFGSQPWPLPASLMLGFEIEVHDDTLTVDENELVEARWFAPEELEALTLSGPISLSRWMIESWRGHRA